MFSTVKISFSVASQKVLPEVIAKENISSIEELVKEMNLLQMDDDGALAAFVTQALAAYPDKVAEYKAGKKGVIGLFMGEIMKLSGGKADPKKSNQMLLAELDK